MKKFVISFGRGLIDFSAWLWVIAIIVCGVIALFNDVGIGLAILFCGLIIFVISYYLIYLFISINDNLTEINQNLAPKQEDEPIKEENIGLNGKVYKEN